MHSISGRCSKLNIYQIKFTLCLSGISIYQCKIVTLKFHQFIVWPLLHHLQIFRYRMSKDCDLRVNCSNEQFAVFLSYLFCTVKPGWWSHKYAFNYLFTHIPLLLIFLLASDFRFCYYCMGPRLLCWSSLKILCIVVCFWQSEFYTLMTEAGNGFKHHWTSTSYMMSHPTR